MKQKLKILAWPVTIVFIIVLIILISNAIISIQKQTEENCFTYLDEEIHSLKEDLCKTIEMDNNVLSAMAALIAVKEDHSDNDICAIMNSYSKETSYVDYVELLRPDNTMLDSNGTVRNVEDSFEFDKEAKKGSYVSNICFSTKDSGERVIRNAVPVRKNGKTVSMLYGVIRLNDFKEEYNTNIYNGKAYVYLVEGDTGDFLLDTWHKSFGNISDFFDRESISGDSFRDVAANIKKGKPGNLSFASKTTGDTLYMHYESVGINNWSILVTVQDKYALKYSYQINDILFEVRIQCGVLIFLYMLLVTISLLCTNRNIRRIGSNDQVTGLQNRNAFEIYCSTNKDKTFNSISCVYIDANGLHELNNRHGHAAGDKMLLQVGKELQNKFSNKTAFRVGGDEFIAFTEEMNQETCASKLKMMSEALEKNGYSISYGVVTQQNITGLSEIIKIADERMLENKKEYYSKHDRRMR